ncbi:MAG TPA: hypothetical protein GXX70_06490 [Tepidimicrobium sp.]|nr:hypothetical protein [Tepidimicrobium sp.]
MILGVSILAKIYAPNKGYAGVTAGVSFSNGVGETEDKWLIQWFKNKGYKVVEEKKLEELTVAELRKMAAEKGIEGYSDMRKAELIKTLEG